MNDAAAAANTYAFLPLSLLTHCCAHFQCRFGFGTMIASIFAKKYGQLPQYINSLKSFVSFNGYIGADSQLAAIMHSSVNVFKAFPSARVDLPVSYFTQFIFSEDYLAKVSGGCPHLLVHALLCFGPFCFYFSPSSPSQFF